MTGQAKVSNACRNIDSKGPESPSVQRKPVAPQPTLSMAGNQQLMRALGIRAKLSVTQSDDPEEREADSAADAFLAKQTIQLKCSACSSRTHEDPIQRSPTPASASTTKRDLQSAVATARQSSGEPLSPTTRSFFEPRLGHDFAGVRVHTHARAANSAQAIAARAYTVGSNIVFNQGEYDSSSAAGRRLLAHELTHVTQQYAGVQHQPDAGNSEDKYEREADAVADRVVGGNNSENLAVPEANISASPAPSIQRQGDEHVFETKPEFAERVHDKAAERLTRNMRVLDEWANYVAAMQAFQLQAQLMTGMAVEYATAAAPYPSGRERFERGASTHMAAERNYFFSTLDVDAEYKERANNFLGFLAGKTHGYETTPSFAEGLQVVAGVRQASELEPSVQAPPDPRYHYYAPTMQRIRDREIGGCQACHNINLAWQRTINRYGDPLPHGPIFQFGLAGEDNPVFGGPLIQHLPDRQRDSLLAYVQQLGSQTAQTVQPVAPGSPDPRSQTGVATYPRVNPFVPDLALPTAVQAPPPRTDLCGELPSTEDSERRPALHTWGPASRDVASVIARVDAVLTPLGPRGYRVLGRPHFDALYSMTHEGMERVRDDIIASINSRKADYDQLRASIRRGDVPYEELCPVVDELLSSTNALVKLGVLQDVRAWQTRETVLATLELLLLGLTILFPPAAIVTVPAGIALGISRVALGIDQRRQGRQWTQGTGSGVYSLSQQAQAPTLEERGNTNIITGLLMTGISGFSTFRMVQEMRATAQLIQALERGAVITSANYPGVKLLAHQGRLLMVTDTGEVLGYGFIRNGQISFTRLDVPFSPFTPGGGAATTAAPGTSIVPYGPTAIVPYGQGVGHLAFPFGRQNAFVPFGASSFALGPTAGFLGPSGGGAGSTLWHPPLALPQPSSPLLLPGAVGPAPFPRIPTATELISFEASGARLTEIINTGGPIAQETRGYGAAIVDVAGYTGPTEIRSISAAATDVLGEGAAVAHAPSPAQRTLPAARSWTGAPGGGVQHINDAEVELLELIRSHLPQNATGTIHILSLRGSGGVILAEPFPHCPSCVNAVFTFEGDYPGVRIISHAAAPPQPRAGGMRLRLPDE